MRDGVPTSHVMGKTPYVEADVYKRQVDTRLLGQVHGTFLHGIGGVLHHLEVPRETKVLWVLGNEGEVHALLPIHHERCLLYTSRCV